MTAFDVEAYERERKVDDQLAEWKEARARAKAMVPIEQAEPDWSKLGGSEAYACVTGVGLFDVVVRHLMNIQSPDDPFTLTGKALEPIILNDVGSAFGVTVTKPPSITCPKGRVWQRVSLDGIIEEWPHAIVDAKFRKWSHKWGEDGTDEVDEPVLWQMQTYLEATDREVAFVGVYFGGPPLRIFRIEAHPELQAMAVEAMARVWRDFIVPKRMPPFEASDVARAWMDGRFEETDGKEMILATEEAEELARAFRELKSIASKSEAQAEALALQIQEMIGEAHGLECRHGKITWSRPKPRETVDWRSIAEGMVALAGDSLSERRGHFRQLIEKHTKHTRTKRTLRSYWKETE